MWYNLKNFPRFKGNISYYLDAVIPWKIGFEKELRREIEKTELYIVEANTIKLKTERERRIARLFLEKGITASIKEVLGVSD